MDCWQEVIKNLEDRAAELEVFARKAREAAETIRALAAEKGKKIQIKENEAEKNRKSEPRKTRPIQSGKVHMGRKGKFSQYEGVYDGRKTAQGRQRYVAGIWMDGKSKRLGRFWIEEEAAAAVQEAKGNKAEAKRLRELARQKADEAEQRENNPNRETKSRRPAKAAVEAGKDHDDPQVETIGPGRAWECTNCFKQGIAVNQPDKCSECGHEGTMRLLE